MSDISAFGQYIYGGGWQSALARDFKLNLRSVQRWVAGTHPVPQGVWDNLISLAAAKQLEGAMPIIREIAEKQGGLPSCIDLTVYPDDKVPSIHQRTWSFEADLAIKKAMANILIGEGLKARVVVR